MATLLSPIGSYFNESNRSSYIGTSYLLSVCCFTPLYGACCPLSRAIRRCDGSPCAGRLSDILGRRGAMMAAAVLVLISSLVSGLCLLIPMEQRTNRWKVLIAVRVINGCGE